MQYDYKLYHRTLIVLFRVHALQYNLNATKVNLPVRATKKIVALPIFTLFFVVLLKKIILVTTLLLVPMQIMAQAITNSCDFF